MPPQLTGKSLIGSADGPAGQEFFRAISPQTNSRLDTEFHRASPDDVNRAAQLAHDASLSYANLPGKARAAFLQSIATNIESVSEPLIARANLETALPLPRLQGELARTCGQLRLFAMVVEQGSWTAPRIDRADPERKPLRKPDVRSVLRPLGPIVVFGASNFPLAFSVAGGDTASALAAGNPVIAKAHPAHPGASELVGRAIQAAVKEHSFPEGVFSLLFDSGTSVASLLVQHPLIKAGAFTGSHRAGRALFDLAGKRRDPIPFFAEMASTNPLFLLPGALAVDPQKIAGDLHASFTLGAGQFCTKPGLVFVFDHDSTSVFLSALRSKVADTPPFTLLTPGIASAFQSEISHREKSFGLKPIATAKQADSPGASAIAALYEIDLSALASNPSIAQEHFGPSTIVVRAKSKAEVLAYVNSLDGHLTATIHGSEADLEEFSDLLRVLETKVGRIVFNGFPTGVEVCQAMIHGGPYPATTDARFTSVGTSAMLRFARPVCYQDFPDTALPLELKRANPLGVLRLVDGEYTRDPA
ncbi:MAG: aldehyde dehydrogenase (NADP(+)) [Candidatus Acidiferrum sp.]